jgi:hypothetical protein
MCRSSKDNKIDGKINGKSSRQQKYRSGELGLDNEAVEG